MKDPRFWFACAAVGAIAGAISRVDAFPPSRTDAALAAPPSNTVVLNSEKAVTLSRQDITLRELAACLSEQTGRQFTLDKRFEEVKEVYSVQLGAVPLTRVLDASAYMVRGVWERRGLDYHLRPMTAEEVATDALLMDSVGKRLHSYLRELDPGADGLMSSQSSALTHLRVVAWRGLDDLGDVAWDDPSRWSLVAGDSGVRVTYRSGKPGERPVTRGITQFRKLILTIGEGKRL